MAEVFTTKETVFFVGGIGAKTGSSTVGGVTKAKYDAMVAEDGYFDMSRIMSVNGSYKWLGDGGALTIWIGSQVQITKANAFIGVEPGMLAYLGFSGVYDSGIYEVQDCDDNTLMFFIPYVSDVTVPVVRVGGAFNTVQNAIDRTDATAKNVWILDNKDETLSSTLDITSGGNTANNSYLYIWGFNAAPPTNLFEPSGDMDFNETTKTAGAYYVSSLGIKLNGSVPAAKKVIIDGGDGGFDLLTFTIGRNVHFRNFEFKGVADTFDIFVFTNSAINITFFGCAITGNYEYITDGASLYTGFFNDCYFKESQNFGQIRFNSLPYACIFYSCLFDVGSNLYVYAPFATFFNSIFIDGSYGLRAYWVNAVNCTFYKQTISSIAVESVIDVGHLINCIEVPAIGASDFVGSIGVDGGSLGMVLNNCYYGADANPITKPFDDNGTAFTPFGGGNLAQDPAMIDPANNNFTPRNQEVLTHGVSDAENNPGQIGAVIRKYNFTGKSRQSSPGRMNIFR